MCLCYILRLYINTYVVRNVVSTRTSSNYDTQQKKKIIDYRMPATIVHQQEREPAAEYKHQYKRMNPDGNATDYTLLLYCRYAPYDSPQNLTNKIKNSYSDSIIRGT